ncbi:MAG: calcium/sodium antiporter [Cyclobacteriaceae bacterium]
MVITILLLLSGFVILIKGADFLVNGASSVAKKYGISNLAIGLTVVAFGTSMPELTVSLLAAINGQSDASFGNVIGSNNFNILCVLGVSGIIFPLVVQKNTIKFEVPISLLAAMLLFVLVNDRMLWNSDGDMLSRFDSLVLIIFFGAFLLYVYRTMSRTSDLDQGPSAKVRSVPISVGFIVLGLVMLIGGGKLVVDNAIDIAHYFGLSERLIGLTILAAGTSFPELATSAVAAYRKNTDIAIGNVIGSNIFNIVVILGITGVVTPIPFNDTLNFDVYVLLASSLVLLIFMFTLGQRKLDRWEALMLLMGYIAYTVVLVGMDSAQLD